MMVAGPSLSVVPLTVHLPLAQVPTRISTELLLETLEVVHAALQRDFGVPRPRIAVAGLNPHAGEGGMFGDEEPRLIEPALEFARSKGILALGPFPADTIFRRAAGGEFDVVIGMYHDQCLIPVKLLDFDRAVNVTLGLSILRTSVDHGTAYDIAGRGVASATSMLAALELACRMCRSRRSAAV
jgi:4-hydroxythreonine-4-phosphate dehydrogenase